MRAIIYSIDHGVSIIYPSDKGNWFPFRGRSYRKDRKAICQVMEKGNQIKPIVEALYVEGNPVPLRSTLKSENVTLEHLEELVAEATNKPTKGFLDTLLRR